MKIFLSAKNGGKISASNHEKKKNGVVAVK